jgi:hypothetical protein
VYQPSHSFAHGRASVNSKECRQANCAAALVSGHIRRIGAVGRLLPVIQAQAQPAHPSPSLTGSAKAIARTQRADRRCRISEADMRSILSSFTLIALGGTAFFRFARAFSSEGRSLVFPSLDDEALKKLCGMSATHSSLPP